MAKDPLNEPISVERTRKFHKLSALPPKGGNEEVCYVINEKSFYVFTAGAWLKLGLGVSTEVGTTYTFDLADQHQLVRFTNASAVTATVPTNSSVPYPIGTKIHVEQAGAGLVTFVAAGGVTVNKLATKTLAMAGRYGVVELIKVDTNVWSLSGDLAAV